MSRYRTMSNGRIFCGHYKWDKTSKYGYDKSGSVCKGLPATECWDTVHPYPYDQMSDLTIKSWKGQPARVSFGGQFTREVRRYSGIPLFPHSTPPTVWEGGWDALETAAMVNVQDSAPIADVLTSAAEATDVPFMLRSVFGRLMSSFLTYRWVVEPLLGDLERLANLQQEVARRLERHRKKHRTKRWRGRGNGVAVVTLPGSSYTTQAIGGGMSLQSKLYYSLTRNDGWYVAELEPRVPFKDILAEQMNSAFHSGVRNLRTGEVPTQSGITALYNAIPWSFLIDYFSTLGMVIKYHDNMIVYKVPRVNLMANYVLRRDIDPIDPGGYPGFQSKPGYWEVEYKRRKVVLNPAVRLAFAPWITAGQAANLAALFSSLSDLKRRM